MRKFLVSLVFLAAFNCTAQRGPKDIKLTMTDKKQLVDKVTSLLREHYVFVDRVDTITEVLNTSLMNQRYDNLQDLNSFGDQLNLDLESISRDKHLKIYFSPKIVRQLRQEATAEAPLQPNDEFLAMLRSENYRMRKVEILHGNIGYFKLDNFVELKYCKETLSGAINFISNASAIVLDLSDCGGGASETMDFILSHFLPESTKIGELTFRKNNEVRIGYTLSDPGIKRLTEVPLYILVSGNTASAAEALSACLQAYKRAVVIGSQTKGLGNPGQLFVVNDVLYMFITTAVGKTAVTGVSLDGIGVTPDVQLPSSTAFNFNRAMEEACRGLAEKTNDKKLRDAAMWLAFEYRSYQDPSLPDSNFVATILGSYEGGRQIVKDGRHLYFTQGNTKRRLSYMDSGVFAVDGRKDYRLRFDPGKRPVRNMRVLWYDDTSDVYKKQSQGN